MRGKCLSGVSEIGALCMRSLGRGKVRYVWLLLVALFSALLGCNSRDNASSGGSSSSESIKTLEASSAQPAIDDNDSKRVTLSFYTAMGATSAQIPIWSVLTYGSVADKVTVQAEAFKDLDSFKSLMLAGKGDMWLGHVEGIALARMRGAKVKLVAVTGWRKFWLLSRLDNVQSFSDCKGLRIGTTPVGSPAVVLLNGMRGPDWAKEVHAYEPSVLQMRALGGDYDAIIAPEPVASVILHKVNEAAGNGSGGNNALRRVQSLEDAYGDYLSSSQTVGSGMPSGAPFDDSKSVGGRKQRIPWAGLAVSEDFLREHPDIVGEMVDMMKRRLLTINSDPRHGLDLIPQSVRSQLPDSVVQESMQYDPIHVEKAGDVKEEIARFLRLVLSENAKSDNAKSENATKSDNTKGYEIGKLVDEVVW